MTGCRINSYEMEQKKEGGASSAMADERTFVFYIFGGEDNNGVSVNNGNRLNGTHLKDGQIRCNARCTYT